MKYILGLVGMSLFFVSSVWAKPEVKIMVELNPGGSFIAQSANVKGFAQVSSTGYTAEGILLDLNSLMSGIELRDSHMKVKYFETTKFPTASFSQGKTQGNTKEGNFSGILTVHGVPQNVQGTYSANDQEVTGRFKCTLSQFNIPPAKYMGVGVEDSVEVEVTLPLAKKP